MVESFTSPRAWAFTLLGLHEIVREYPDKHEAVAARDRLTLRLVALWNAHASEAWPWFESCATYDNARLCQALIRSGESMPHADALEIGLQGLRWLAALQRAPEGHFRPVGSNGFCTKDGLRADFDQQPVEAQAMVSACLEAWRVTQDPFWSLEARRAFEWFLGRNDLGQSLYDPGTGGCSDGLHRDRVSENQGAESTLAFQLALAEMVCAQHLVTPLSLVQG